jgi:hypothetical protein
MDICPVVLPSEKLPEAIYMGIKGNFDYTNKVFQLILLPRIICIGLGGLVFDSSYFISPSLFIASAIIDLSIGLALFIPVRDQLISTRIPGIVMSMFGAFGHMLIAMTTAGRAAGKFLHTPHNAKKMRIGIEAQRIFRKKKHGMDIVALELSQSSPAD